MKTVYVVAWHFNGGGGFEWYRTAAAADRALVEERKNCAEFKKEGWEAYRFDFVTQYTNDDHITDEIDRDLDELCVGNDPRALNRATYKAGNRKVKVSLTVELEVEATQALTDDMKIELLRAFVEKTECATPKGLLAFATFEEES